MKLNKLILFLFILFIVNVSALSNESIQAKDELDNAEKNILEMFDRDIPVKRVNESYSDALQIYSAQKSLEERTGRANYKLVLEYTNEIERIKGVSIQAKDELNLFIETFKEADKETDFDDYLEEYNKIINSFNEERFEETLVLIKKGYEDIIEIQASQTATKMFYLTTTKTIKDFFIRLWLELVIGIICISVLLFVFWKRIEKWKLKRKLNHLFFQKKSINGLIKKMQKDYFKTKHLSENEYRIKLKKYEELLREIERQVMVLRKYLRN